MKVFCLLANLEKLTKIREPKSVHGSWHNHKIIVVTD